MIIKIKNNKKGPEYWALIYFHNHEGIRKFFNL